MQRRRSWSLILIGTAVGVLVVAAIPLLVAATRPTGPEDVVRSYFDALADRDAGKARGFLDTDPAEQAELAGQADSMLTSRGYTPPSDVRLEVLNALTGSAAVRADYDLAGATQRLELTLVRNDASPDGPGWRIQNGLLPLVLPTDAFPGDRLLVAGTPVPASQQRFDAVFPGAYLVALGEHPLHEAPPITTPAGDGSAQRFQIRLRPAVRQAIEPQVRAYLDSCATSTALIPPRCPFGVVSARPVTDVAWKITQYPTLDVQLDSTGDARISSTAAGAAEVTGRTDLPVAPAFARSTSFSVAGFGRVADGKLIFEPAH